ncbi:MAG: hypothetical protein ACXVIH_14455, partial [Ilumatobacteraceae bacterium]
MGDPVPVTHLHTRVAKGNGARHGRCLDSHGLRVPVCSLPLDFVAEVPRQLRYQDKVRRVLFFVFAISISCGGGSSTLPLSTQPPATYFTAERTDSSFVTADHFLASIEMQISGEPFAQLLGRNLAGFDRFNRTTDLYIDPGTG